MEETHTREDRASYAELPLTCREDNEGRNPKRQEHNFRFKLVGLLVTIIVFGVCFWWFQHAPVPLKGSPDGVIADDDDNTKVLSGIPLWALALDEEAANNHQFCNPEIQVPLSDSPPRAFSLTEEWRDFCLNKVGHPKNAPAYMGRNWCWAWMKYGGCYDVNTVHGHWSWPKAQKTVSDKGYAPDPAILPLNGLLNSEMCERESLGIAETAPTAEQMKEALEWFNRTFSVYVLNLPTETERWKNISAQLQHLGIDGEQVFGVDLRAAGGFAQARKEGLVSDDFSFQKAQRIASANMGGIVGTVGTAAAHFRALGTAARNAKQRPLAMIMEDDVQLSPDFVFRVRKLLTEEAPCDWNAISLKSRCPYGECVSPHLTKVRPDGNEPEDRCYHGVNYGFYAMIYRVSTLPDIWKMLSQRVWRDDRPRCLDIDVALASLSEQVPYYAVPSVQQPGFLREGHMGSARWIANFQTLPPSVAS